jgi:hypothetical protein
VPEEFQSKVNVHFSYGDDYLDIECSYTRDKTEEEIAAAKAALANSKQSTLAYYEQQVAKLKEELGAV